MGMSSGPTTMSTLNPGQQAAMKATGQWLIPQIGKGVPAYQGQQVAPLDQGYGAVRQILSGYNPMNPNAQGQQAAIGSALGGQPSYSLDPATTQNWFNQSVANPLMKNYQSNIAPQINQGFAGTGGLFSTARGFAQQRALSDLQGNEANQLAQAQMGNQQLSAQLAESAANRQLQAVGLANQQQNQPLLSAAAIEQLLGPFQQNAQAQNTAQYNEFLRTQPYNSPLIPQTQQYINTNTLAAYQQPNNNGLIGSGIGALLGLLGGPLGVGLGAGLGGLLGGGGNPGSADLQRLAGF